MSITKHVLPGIRLKRYKKVAMDNKRGVERATKATEETAEQAALPKVKGASVAAVDIVV